MEHILSHVRSDLYVTCFHDSKKGFKVPGVWLHAQAETSLAQAAREMGRVTRRWVLVKHLVEIFARFVKTYKFNFLRLTTSVVFMPRMNVLYTYGQSAFDFGNNS